MKTILFKFLYYLKLPFKALNKEFKEGLIFPMTYKGGMRLRFDWVELTRNILNKKWKYLFITYGLISVFVFGYMHNKLKEIKAASYGFEQTTWTEADTGAVALHDNDQEDYYKFYSKDNNINTSVSGEVSLNNASTTVTETNTTEFNQGSSQEDNNVGIYKTDNKIQLSIRNVTYCKGDGNWMTCGFSCEESLCNTKCISRGYVSGVCEGSRCCGDGSPNGSLCGVLPWNCPTAYYDQFRCLCYN